jgi:hypothetical protein
MIQGIGGREKQPCSLAFASAFYRVVIVELKKDAQVITRKISRVRVPHVDVHAAQVFMTAA